MAEGAKPDKLAEGIKLAQVFGVFAQDPDDVKPATDQLDSIRRWINSGNDLKPHDGRYLLGRLDAERERADRADQALERRAKQFNGQREAGFICSINEYAERAAIAESRLTSAVRERDKLQAFKDWTHRYLDAHGVPHHPPGSHGAEGCRIGDRMDWLMQRIAELEAQLVSLPLRELILPPLLDPDAKLLEGKS